MAKAKKMAWGGLSRAPARSTSGAGMSGILSGVQNATNKAMAQAPKPPVNMAAAMGGMGGMGGMGARAGTGLAPSIAPTPQGPSSAMKKGGYVRAADGIAKRGKTKGRMV